MTVARSEGGGTGAVALAAALCASAAAVALAGLDPDALLRRHLANRVAVAASLPLLLLAAGAAVPFGAWAGRRVGSGAPAASAWFAGAIATTALVAPDRIAPNGPADPLSALLLAGGGLAGAALAGWAAALGREAAPIGVATRIGLAIGAVHAAGWTSFLMAHSVVARDASPIAAVVALACVPVAIAIAAIVSVAGAGPPAPIAQALAALATPLGLLLAVAPNGRDLDPDLREGVVALSTFLVGASLAAVVVRARRARGRPEGGARPERRSAP